MKKSFLLSAITIFYISTSFAQDVQFGMKAGMNVATLGSSSLGFLPRIAYHAGATAEFITTPFFSLQTELVYSLQGAAIDRSQNIYLNYHYLNVPLMAKVYFYEDACFELGVQYGRQLKAVDKNDYYAQNQSGELKKNDFALLFGLCYTLNDEFTFGIRYNLGITNTSPQDIIYEKRYTNRVLQLSIGYLF
ncbi:MAG: PorT family protein [Cyclobacteriaceae bacterium]|nr:PorT family protein [Cyclobacteriaceae bacterium]